MTVGKTDPNYGAALEAVRKATAAVSGKDPVTGAPYDPVPETPEVEPYAGLPTTMAEVERAVGWAARSVRSRS